MLEEQTACGPVTYVIYVQNGVLVGAKMMVSILNSITVL